MLSENVRVGAASVQTILGCCWSIVSYPTHWWHRNMLEASYFFLILNKRSYRTMLAQYSVFQLWRFRSASLKYTPFPMIYRLSFSQFWNRECENPETLQARNNRPFRKSGLNAASVISVELSTTGVPVNRIHTSHVFMLNTL